jgi:hypothetical protein
MQVHIILNNLSGDVFLFDPAERQARPVSTEFAIKSPDITVALKQGDRIHFAAVHEPLLAPGGHSSHDAECPFLNQSGHLVARTS